MARIDPDIRNERDGFGHHFIETEAAFKLSYNESTITTTTIKQLISVKDKIIIIYRNFNSPFRVIHTNIHTY